MVIATNQRNAAFREKQDSKWHKTFSIKFNIIVWSTTEMYGKLIYGITRSGGFYPFCCGDYKDTIKHAKGLFFFIENFQLSSIIKVWKMNTAYTACSRKISVLQSIGRTYLHYFTLSCKFPNRLIISYIRPLPNI